MDNLRDLSKSPLPAWSFAAALGLSPLYRPIELPKMRAYPSNVQVAVFTAFTALGGFITYDNDPKDGAAVVGVWSTLYALSNFKRALWNLKFGPKFLVGLAVANGGLYGAQALGVFPENKVEEVLA